ncbi:MAG: hypothetical protein Q9218_008034 [Villophora microphyllina]
MAALPTTEDPSFDRELDFAITNGVSVNYIDAATMRDNASATSRSTSTIKASDDHKLRRCAGLGWVVQKESQKVWRKTGHVLVIDMDDRAIRHRHPWFVLASEWPTDIQDIADDNFTTYAGEAPLNTDPTVAGVLPGESARTTIGSIHPKGNHDGKDLVLQQLGRNFEFDLINCGGGPKSHNAKYGLPLVHVTDWYWDPKAKREICYTKDGSEYLRYDPKTSIYQTPAAKKPTPAQQVGQSCVG